MVDYYRSFIAQQGLAELLKVSIFYDSFTLGERYVCIDQ